MKRIFIAAMALAMLAGCSLKSQTFEFMRERGAYDVWAFGSGGVVEDQAWMVGIVSEMDRRGDAGRIAICDGKLISAHAFGFLRQVAKGRGYYTDRCVLGLHAASAFGVVPMREYTEGQAQHWPAAVRDAFLNSTHRFRHITFAEYCGPDPSLFQRLRCDQRLMDLIPEAHVDAAGITIPEG